MDTLRGQIGSFDDDTRDEDYSADIDDGVLEPEVRNNDREVPDNLCGTLELVNNAKIRVVLDSDTDINHFVEAAQATLQVKYN